VGCAGAAGVPHDDRRRRNGKDLAASRHSLHPVGNWFKHPGDALRRPEAWWRVVIRVASIYRVAVLTLALAAPGAQAGKDDVPVDVELVLAVDVSHSMDAGELRLQRAGYAAALRDPDVIAAIESGIYGRIAVTYVEWGGEGEQRIVIPWQVIDGRAHAEAAAARLARWHGPVMGDTSISSALLFANLLLRNNGFAGTRRIIDISGDGANNWGPPVVSARDAVLRDGITINGLPVTLHPGGPGGMPAPLLAIYYEDCVIGGPGAFVLSVPGPELLAETIRRKMVQELSQGGPLVERVSVTKAAARIDCEIEHRVPNMTSPQ
jgi:hypothetical protein